MSGSDSSSTMMADEMAEPSPLNASSTKSTKAAAGGWADHSLFREEGVWQRLYR